MTPRIFLAAQQTANLEFMRTAVPLLFAYQITGVARSGAEVMRRLPQCACDVLLIELWMKPLDGAAVLRMLRSRRANIPTVIFTGSECDLTICEALASRPEAFVHMADETDCWKQAINAAAIGGGYISPRIAAAKRGADGVNGAAELSPLQRAVLVMIVRGQNKYEVACQLGISANTARHHRERLMKKLGVHSVEALCEFAFRHGLIDSSADRGSLSGCNRVAATQVPLRISREHLHRIREQRLNR